jgi:hypothetical protein
LEKGAKKEIPAYVSQSENSVTDVDRNNRSRLALSDRWTEPNPKEMRA